MLNALRTEPLVRMLGHTTITLFLSTLAYFAVPVRFDRIQPWTLGRVVVAVAALGLMVLLFRTHLRWSARRQSRDWLRIQWLLSALYGLVLLFALGYAALAVQLPAQFDGLENRADALYFSVTLVATVGFGDIHPAGTAARLLATTHMVFNLIYLGTAIRMLAGRAAAPSSDGAPGPRSDAGAAQDGAGA
jgi:voltage-gated potassium channel